VNSSEIKPEAEEQMEQEASEGLLKEKFHYPEKVISAEEIPGGLRINFTNHRLELLWYRSGVVRVIFADSSNFTRKTTPAVCREFVPDKLGEGISYQEEASSVLVQGPESGVRVKLKPFSLNFLNGEGETIQADIPGRSAGWWRNQICCQKELRPEERIYGLGEKTGFLDKRGRSYTMWNTDAYEPHVPSTDPLYISIPLYLGFIPGNSYGVYFDNSFRSHFDIGHSSSRRLFYRAEGGSLDYFWLAGPELEKVIKSYTWLTGRTPLPPLWSLGYHQSRYSYYPQEKVLELADNFREQGIPCDAFHLDIHYMDGYRVFTWDQDRFPRPEILAEKLQEQGINPVTIIDPGVKIDPEYQVYRTGQEKDYFCRYLDGRLCREEVWPGETAFPDFTREEVRRWWKSLHRDFLKTGIRGFWNDMNEPAAFNEKLTLAEEVEHLNDGDPGSHLRFHNLYALEEARATSSAIKEYQQERPFVLTRAGFAGIQRYAAAWTGDNRSFWRDLELVMPMLANLGLSGLGFSGADVGGFTGDVNGELLTRWTQLGAFMPFFRNHTSLNTRDQEPWAFGEPYTSIIKRYIKLRYQLLPEIYNLFYQQSEEGLPVWRPVVLNYPADPETHNLSDEVMIGNSLLLAPVVKPDSRERRVYLPGTGWYDFWSGNYYQGSESYLMAAPLEKMPIFVAENSLLLTTDEDQLHTGEGFSELVLNIYPGRGEKSSFGSIYEDDGISFAYQEGEYNLFKYQLISAEDSLKLELEREKHNYSDGIQHCKIRLAGLEAAPQTVELNGKEVKDNYKYQAGELELVLSELDQAELLVKY